MWPHGTASYVVGIDKQDTSWFGGSVRLLKLPPVGVARSSRSRPHSVYSGSFIGHRNTPLHACACGVTRPPRGPIPAARCALLASLPPRTFLDVGAVGSDIPRVLRWSSSCGTARVHVSHDARTHASFTFFSHFFAPCPGILHLALSSVVCALPATSDFDVYP